MSWLEELHDEMALLEEQTDQAAPIAWARALRRDHGQGAADVVLGASSVPPAVRRIALEELVL